MQVFAITNHVGIMINADVNAKNWLIKECVIKDLFGINLFTSDCECECDKLCDIGEYLDNKNCKCRKKLIGKLAEECSENIDGNEIIYNSTLNAIPLNDYGKIYNPCTLWIVLLIIFFIISVSVSSIFIYFHWCLKRRYTETTIYWMQFHWTYKWEISKKLTWNIEHITFLMKWLILKTLIQTY